MTKEYINLDLKRNAKRNALFGLLEKLTTLAFPFLTRTIIIYYLGAEYIGLGSLFSSVLQVLSIGELGFSSAITFCMYKPVAENDKKAINRLLLYYRNVYKVIGCVILVVGIILLPFLPKLIKGDVPGDINLYILYCMYLGNTVIGYLFFAYRHSLLSAYQREDIVSKINMVIQLIGGIVQIILLISFRNYYFYYGVTILISIIKNIFLFYTTKRMYPQYYCEGRIEKEEKALITEKIKGLMIGKIGGISRNSLDSIFISGFLGLTITAMYSNYFYIMNSVTLLLAVFSNAIVAGIGNRIIIFSKEKNHKDMLQYDFLYMWLVMICTACLLCLYQPFTSLVWGERMLFPDHIMILFCLYFFQIQNGQIRYVYATAAGLWWENRYRDIAETLANCLLNYFLGKYFGVVGILVATLISNFVFGFIWATSVVYKHYFTDIKKTEYFVLHTKLYLVAIFSCILSFVLCKNVHFSSILGTILFSLCVAIIIPNVVIFFSFRNTDLFNGSISILKGILKDKKTHPTE